MNKEHQKLLIRRSYTSNQSLMPKLAGRAQIDKHINHVTSVKKELIPEIKSSIVTLDKDSGFSLSNKTGNTVAKNGIALGYGLEAASNQMVVGQFNNPDSSSYFQVGNGYVEESTGRVIKQSVMNVTKDGIQMFGGEIVADFSVGDLTFTQDVYYKTPRGEVKKLYLKESVNKNTLRDSH